MGGGVGAAIGRDCEPAGPRCRDAMSRPVVSRPRFTLVFALVAAAAVVVGGIPTDVIPNPWFRRMTPVEVYSYPLLLVVSLLAGLLVASRWGMRRAACPVAEGGVVAGVASGMAGLAIGCPVCNTLVVTTLGAAGAMAYYAPVQPWLGAPSVLFLCGSLVRRRHALRAPPRPAEDRRIRPERG